MENACPNIKRVLEEKKLMIPDETLTDTDFHSRDEPVQKRQKVHHTSTKEEEKLIWNDVVMDHPARLAGRIMRVEVENFLCFPHSELKLDPFVNFITGKNGAGKSTYATAIAVALGSKTIYRKQHRKLEDYIKADSSSATIRLYMNNQGEHAYRRDEFGPCILLTRKISRRSADSYSLSCADGTKRIVGRAKFMDALQEWGIQIDNPVFFMDQEESKTFLVKNKPAEFYRFFYNASGLAYAEQLTEVSEDAVNKAADQLTGKEKELENAEKDLTEWIVKRDAADSRFGAAEEYRAIEAQMEWWKAQTAALAVENLNKELAEIDATIHEIDGQLADEQRVSVPASSRKSGGRNVHFLRRMADLQHELEQIDKRWKDQIVQKEADIKAQQKLIEDKEKKLRTQNRDLRSSSRRRTADSSFDVDQINVLQHSLEDAEQKRVKLVSDIHERKELELKADKLKHRRDCLQQKIEEVNNTNNGDVAKLDDYYCIHDRITSEIDKRKLKVAEVTGPVGKFVDLRDQQYRSAVDQTIGNVLHSYIFDLDLEQDMEPVIMEVRKSCRLSNIPIAPVALSSKSRMGSASTNVLLRNTENGIYSIKDAVNFGSCRVSQFLSEVTKLDRTVLVDSPGTAAKLLSELNIDDNMERMIDNKGNTYEYCDEYAIISSPVASFFHTPGCDEQLARRDLDQHLQEATTSLSAIEQSLNRTADATCALEQKKDENDQTVLDISRRLATLRSSDSFVARSSICTEDEEDLSRSIKEHKKELEELKFQKKALERHRKEGTAQHKQDITSLEAQQVLTVENVAVNETPIKSGRKGGRKRHIVVQLEQDRQFRTKQRLELLSKIEDKDLEYKEHEQKCAQHGINVQSGVPKENRKVLEARLEELRRKDIAHSVDGGYSLKVCLEHVERFSKSCKQARKQLRIFRQTVTTAKIKREDQKSKEAELRRRFENRTAQTCETILRDCGFTVILNFDSERKELYILVSPANDCNKLGPLETLSGGEKATVMVALLVSFWESNHPFRILDEFDCYMDAQNREAALFRLIKKALDDRVQCIFLSPLEFDFDKMTEMVGPEERSYIKIVRI